MLELGIVVPTITNIHYKHPVTLFVFRLNDIETKCVIREIHSMSEFYSFVSKDNEHLGIISKHFMYHCESVLCIDTSRHAINVSGYENVIILN